MSERRSILVVTPWKRRWELGHGAGLADDVHFIDGFLDRGYDVHYVSPRDREPPDVSAAGYTVHPFLNFYDSTAGWPVFAKRLLWPVFFTVLASWRAWRVGRVVRPMVVLGQTHLASAAVFFVARALRIPSAVKLFGVMDLGEPMPQAAQIRRHGEMLAALRFPHDAWIVLDDGTRGDEALRAHGIPADRIHFIPNGVNTDWSSEASDADWLPERFRMPRTSPIVLYMARLVDWKRPDAFVRVAARVRAEFGRRVVFVVAGEGTERARCEAIARSLGILDDVYFVGALPHEHVPDAMATADVFVATSRHSNRSIAVCEALVCGVPVVAFDTGQTHAVVRNDETGFLVPDGDEVALAEGIVTLIRDEDRRRAMGRRARAFAKSHFVGWPERVAEEVRILEDLAARRAPKTG